MKKFSTRIKVLCFLSYLALGLPTITGEIKDKADRTSMVNPVSCVIFTIQSTSHEANEIRKNADEVFFSGLQEVMRKYKIEKSNIIFRSPTFQNRNYYLIVRVGKRGGNDPIIGEICGAIRVYSERHAIVLKSIEHLTETLD